MRCPACGTTTEQQEARFCPVCGGELVEDVREDHLIGQTIGGRYRVTHVLAEGGMGKVYVAEQQMGKTLRKVAIKTLLADMAKSGSQVERFLSECSLVAELDHPNTIKFYDWGQTPSGELFIAMELLTGESLAAVVERAGKLAPERLDLILSQICGSLQEAHDKGIVHRDVKPENILLTSPAGEEDFVKVVDFGIAKRQADALGLTPLGLVLGSPAYMSPEQFTRVELDGRSDVYSLAVVAYEALTGRLPFEAPDLLDWPKMHAMAEPMPFEASGVHPPESMRRGILRGLAKRRDDRPSSMREFFAELTIGTPRRSSLTSGRPASSLPVRPSLPPLGSSPAPIGKSLPPIGASQPPPSSSPSESSKSSLPPLIVPAAPRVPSFVGPTERPDASSVPPTVREPVPRTLRDPGRRRGVLFAALAVLVALGAGVVILAVPRLRSFFEQELSAARPHAKPTATMSPEKGHAEPRQEEPR